MDLDVFRYSPACRGNVEPGMAQFGMGQGDAATDSYFETVLTDPDHSHHAVFVARDGAGSLGMTSIMRRPIFAGAGRMVVLLMPQDDEAKAVPFGQAMWNHVVEFGNENGISRFGVSVRDEQRLVQAFLDSSDLSPLQEHHAMGWSGEPVPLAVAQADGVSLEIYEGGDVQTNEGIATLWEWAFRRDTLLPVLTPEVLEESVARDKIWFAVARDTGNRRVVGVSEAGPGNFFSGIAVARSHWGTRVAEGLAAMTMNAFFTRGYTSLFSMVRKTNRASVALHERMNWKVTGSGTIYATPTPPHSQPAESAKK